MEKIAPVTDSYFEDIDFCGEHAVKMVCGGYEGIIVPSAGANLVQLKYMPENMDLLRTPDDIGKLKNNRLFYGMPILFPPNRIEGGRFSVNEREYVFPLNSLDGRHYIHGILRLLPWSIKKMESIEDGSLIIELGIEIGKDTEFFQYFPHEFECSIIYGLSKQGLYHEVRVKNKSKSPMPMGIGFHTALKVPLSPDGTPGDYSIKVSVGKRWELNDRTVPTGNINDLDSSELMLRYVGVPPLGKKFVSEHYTMESIIVDDREFNGVVLTDELKKIRLLYEVDKQYKHWVIWNDNADKGYICPEPQTWAINAPNLRLPQQVTGFKLLEPGEGWSVISRLYVDVA